MYTDVDDGDVDISDDEDHDTGNQDNENFIDNPNIPCDENFHRSFENANWNLDELVDDHLDWLLDNRDSQPEYYTAIETTEIEFDEFENACFSLEKSSRDSFYNASLLRYCL